jgi:hypothetical protein
LAKFLVISLLDKNMFGPQELAQNIQSMLNRNQVTIPDGHKTAFLVHGDTETKEVTAIIARRLGERWQVQGIFDWGVDSGVKTGFDLKWSN